MFIMAEAEMYYKYSRATVEEIATHYNIPPSIVQYAIEEKGWTRDYPESKVKDPAERAELEARIITALAQPGISVRILAMQNMALEKLKDTLATYNPSKSPSPEVIKVIVSAIKEITESLNASNPSARESADKGSGGGGSITINVLNKVPVVEDDRTLNRMEMANGSTVKAIESSSVQVLGSQELEGETSHLEEV